MHVNKSDSSSTTKKWLIGCGIGCGAIVLILIILGVSGFFFIKNIVNEFEDMDAMMSDLTEKYGRIKEFCPDPDGSINPDRIEVFLSARDAFSPAREKLEKSLRILSRGKRKDEIEVKTPGNVFKMVRLGFGVIPQIADFFKSRNQALLDVGMGIGEYYYIYIVAYYSWLGKDPEGGPDFQLVGGWDEDERWDDEEVKEARMYRMRRRIQRLTLPMLRNQLEKLIEIDSSDARERWREALDAEIEAMESDRLRLPWQDGLPEVIKFSLESYRSRLEDSFSPMTNPLEIAFEQR